MQPTGPGTTSSSPESSYSGDSYFGNPYRTSHEQYGFEYMDRNFNSEDDIECVAILGYN